MKNVTIPNWTMFGVKVCGVNLYRKDEDDDSVTYQAAYTLFLDTGTEISDPNDELVITVFSELFSENPEMLALQAVKLAESLWFSVSSTVPIIDEDMQIFRTLDIDQIEKDYTTVYTH